MASRLDTLKTYLDQVEKAIQARVTGNDGIGGAVVEMRKGDRQTRFEQFSYSDLISEKNRLEREIVEETRKAAGMPRRRAARFI